MRLENFFVTGSGRFNLSQKGGDSLQGRYDLYHLYPILYREFVGLSQTYQCLQPNFTELEFSSHSAADIGLIEMGGFPEPLIKGKKTTLNKWQDLYIKRLIQEDVRDFSRVIHLDKLELLTRLLPDRVRSPLSIQSLAEDVETSRDSIKTWLRLFETLFLGFRLAPYTRKIHRSVKKEKKWYFFQWTFCEDEGARFENYMAVQLYTLCQLWRDLGYGSYELFYLRDQDRREVDFVIVKSMKPIALIEAKTTGNAWSTSLEYYARKLNVPAFIVTQHGDIRRCGENRWIVPSENFFDCF